MKPVSFWKIMPWLLFTDEYQFLHPPGQSFFVETDLKSSFNFQHRKFSLFRCFLIDFSIIINFLVLLNLLCLVGMCFIIFFLIVWLDSDYFFIFGRRFLLLLPYFFQDQHFDHYWRFVSFCKIILSSDKYQFSYLAQQNKGYE